MKSIAVAAGVGFLWYLGFTAFAKYGVKPLATKYNVPVLKDL